MDLKHTDLDVAMNALIGSMVKHGYLSEARHVVLVSVESSDSRKAEQLSLIHIFFWDKKSYLKLFEQ